MNDHIFGPLEVTSSFSWDVSTITEKDLNEIVQYTKFNCNYEFDFNAAKETLDDSIFTRIIRVDMNYVKPIIGLLFVTGDENSYYVAYISIHQNFRQQGLARMLFSSLANYIKVSPSGYAGISLRVNRNNTEAITLYKSYGFKIIRSNIDDFVMAESVKDFLLASRF